MRDPHHASKQCCLPIATYGNLGLASCVTTIPVSAAAAVVICTTRSLTTRTNAICTHRLDHLEDCPRRGRKGGKGTVWLSDVSAVVCRAVTTCATHYVPSRGLVLRAGCVKLEESLSWFGSSPILGTHVGCAALGWSRALAIKVVGVEWNGTCPRPLLHLLICVYIWRASRLRPGIIAMFPPHNFELPPFLHMGMSAAMPSDRSRGPERKESEIERH